MFRRLWLVALVTGTIVTLVTGVVALQATGLIHVVATTWLATRPAAALVASPGSCPAVAPHQKLPAVATDAWGRGGPSGPADGSRGPVRQHSPDETHDPLADPLCSFGRVALIAVADDDPTWSFVTVESAQGATIVRRKGDEVVGHVLQAIAWDRVWLSADGRRCQLRLGDPAPRGEGSATAHSRPTDRPRSARTAALARMIHRVDEHEFEVQREALELVAEDFGAILDGARTRPVRHNGELVAIRLSRVRAGSVLHQLGLRSDDQLVSVNGVHVSNQEGLFQLYASLPRTDRLMLTLSRRGQPLDVALHFR